MNAMGPVLRDIHPPPATWWPPAPGWWVLAILVLVIAAGAAWWLRHRARGGLLRAVLQEIDAIEAGHARDGDDARLADRASRLLRRVARCVEPDVAGRAGEPWRAFVHRHARDAESRGVLDHLIDVRFRAAPVLDVDASLRALRRWCRNALTADRRCGSYPPPPPSAVRLSPSSPSALESGPQRARRFG